MAGTVAIPLLEFAQVALPKRMHSYNEYILAFEEFVPESVIICSKFVTYIDVIDKNSQHRSLRVHAHGSQLFLKINSTYKQCCWNVDCNDALPL